MSENVTDDEMIAARLALSGAAYAARSGKEVSSGAMVMAEDVVRRLWQEVRRARAQQESETSQ